MSPSDKRHYLEPESLFHYYRNGFDRVEVNPDPPALEEAFPFHVQWRGDHWIPISMLVFARDAEHAKARVHSALVACRDGHYYSPKSWQAPDSRAEGLLDDLAAGKLTVYSGPVDTAQICAKVAWASNDGPC